MQRSKDLLLAAFAVALLALVGYLWLSPSGLARAPDVEFATLDGRRLDLTDLRGRPVLVTFWATTCPSCLEEMPHLIELYRELEPRGLEIVGVAMYYDPPNQVLELSQRRGIPYPVALDVDARAARAFGDVKLTPTSFLIAPDGRIVKHKIGLMDMADLRQQILDLLPAAGAASSG